MIPAVGNNVHLHSLMCVYVRVAKTQLCTRKHIAAYSFSILPPFAG